MPDALNLSALTALAQKANDNRFVPEGDWLSAGDCEDYGHEPEDAAYIAAVSPEVVRRLIAEIRQTRAALIADREYWGAPHRDPASYDSAREDAWDMGTTALTGISDTPPHAAAPPSNVTASANAGSAGSAGATQEPEG